MTNEELDKRVALLQGWKSVHAFIGRDYPEEVWYSEIDEVGNYTGRVENYSPTTNWQQAGELLEKYKLSVSYVQNVWICGNANSQVQGALAEADTPQVAIVKAVIKLLEHSDV